MELATLIIATLIYLAQGAKFASHDSLKIGKKEFFFEAERSIFTQRLMLTIMWGPYVILMYLFYSKEK